jgi:hypothetical protein
MIATERFVFLHLHKSGGTFVNECLVSFLADARQLGYHLPRHLIPQELAHLPVLGLVRNPWSYYVSWYSFQAARPQPNALFRVLAEHGRLDFKATIRNMLSLGTDDALLERVLAALPKEYTNGGLNLPAHALEPIRGTRWGFYTFLYRYLYGGGTSKLHLGRMESLRGDFLAMLAAVGQPVSEPMRAFILHRGPSNVSQHAAHPQYYDAGLRDLVAERDAEIISRHQYSF